MQQPEQQSEDRVALITGAGSGIGRALALEAAGRGLDLVLVGRRADALAETVDLIGALIGGTTKVKAVACDVTRAEDRARILNIVAGRYRHLDYLVNNAGQIAVGPFNAISDDDLARLCAVNVAAPAAFIRDALPLLRRAKRPRVVNIGSMFGSVAFPRFAAYSATKFAMRGLSDALRRELKPDGIGVTYAAPRATRTPAAGLFEALAEPMGMTFDEPETVARDIWRGVLAGKDTIYPGPVERIGAWLAVLLPGVLDRQLSGVEAELRKSSSAPRVTDKPQPVPDQAA